MNHNKLQIRLLEVKGRLKGFYMGITDLEVKDSDEVKVCLKELDTIIQSLSVDDDANVSALREVREALEFYAGSIHYARVHKAADSYGSYAACDINYDQGIKATKALAALSTLDRLLGEAK